MPCPARIRPFRPRNETELACEDTTGRAHQHHAVLADYAYPGSRTTIGWHDGDRRSFVSTFAECHVPGCLLPSGHEGDHAL